MKTVETVKFITYSGPDEIFEDCRHEEVELQLSESFENVLRAVNSFPNLQAVQLEFAQVCSGWIPRGLWMYRTKQSVEFRYFFLSSLFSSLKITDQKAPRFRSLLIENLQNYNCKCFVESENFLLVLSKIKELRLKIVMEIDSASPKVSWSFPEMHNFFAEFPKVWLKPASTNLESLTIHADHCWGYLPKCDLRSVHFPKLRKLELGNFSFSHDWQLDWILSHGRTVVKLVLNDCPIVSYSYNYGPSDAENYPINPRTDTGDACVWEYPRTWAHYFSALQKKLPKLKVFKFGVGSWLKGVNFDESTEWTNGLTSENYLAFNRGIGPIPWEETAENLFKFHEELLQTASIVTEDKRQKYGDEDQAAYESLVASTIR